MNKAVELPVSSDTSSSNTKLHRFMKSKTCGFITNAASADGFNFDAEWEVEFDTERLIYDVTERRVITKNVPFDDDVVAACRLEGPQNHM